MTPPSSQSIPRSTTLQADPIDPPDLTRTIHRDGRRLIANGSFGTVFRCQCAQNGGVAVKVIPLNVRVPRSDMEEFTRKLRREVGLWKRIDHPNIVPFLGTAQGEEFGSDYPCMVSTWMPNGTLSNYIEGETGLLQPSRTKLIQGSAAGLEYLHSQRVVHGDLHPGNILIDAEHNARLADFGFSRTLSPGQDLLSYLCTTSNRPGAAMWAAPELLYPKLYPDLKVEATLNSDIYSFGSIMFFIISGKPPWDSRTKMEKKLNQFKNPPRPVQPVTPDRDWEFIKRCWSPRLPRNRPSAQDILSFCEDKPEQLLQPSPAPVINVVLFGALGCGKSSIINLLDGKPIAQVSADVDPCTTQPQSYQISMGGKRFQLWDTMGFGLAEGATDRLLPYKQAHTVLRNLADGVNTILLCVRKDGIFASLGSLYRLINDAFYGGRAPIAFVVTHFDTPDEGWWERNHDTITQKTDIPVHSIPHACITTVQTGRDQSKLGLETLLENYATTLAPIFLPSSVTTASLVSARCGLSSQEAAVLAKNLSKPCPANVVFFGSTGAGKSSVINLIAGRTIAEVSSGRDVCTLDSRSYKIDIGMRQFQIWDTVGFGSPHDTRATESATQLIRSLSGQGGIDLIVFIKRSGRLTPSELSCYRLCEEVLCGGQVPVALVVTHLESYNPMEKWWETNGNDLLKLLRGNVIGRTCITSYMCMSGVQEEPWFSDKLEESRLSVRALLEDCVSFRSTLAK